MNLPETFRLAESDLPDSCFAYVPDDAKGADGSKSLRKLRLCNMSGELDCGIIGAAMAAFSAGGFRGNRVQLPSGAVAGAKAKVRSARNRAKCEGDLPDHMTAAEDDAEERPSRDYLAALKGKLKELLGVSISEEDWTAAHRHAMSHAGGKATSRKRQADAAQARAHAEQHPELVVGCDYCAGMDITKLPKDDERVSFTHQASGDRTCYGCRFYRWGGCNLVEGTIEADDLCDLWLGPVQTMPATATPPMQVYAAADHDAGAWRLFVEQAFAEVPEWINVLPKPGVYSHPSYGKIAITADRNARFVTNFASRVYQENLPITLDLEHNSKLSGSVGYFKELKVADDGSVEARVEWTDRGRELIEGDAFKYFSPEWLEVWRDPLTGQAYEDVLIGGAACVRPFFKESALRPLVASEGGLEAPDGAWPADVIVVRRLGVVKDLSAASEGVTVTERESVQLTEDEIREFRELKAKDAEREAERKQMAEQIARLEDERQTSRFTELVRGRVEAGDGAVWHGGIEENVASLKRLAHAFGEESDEFKAEVTLRQATAKTLKESHLFKPVGSREHAAPMDDPAAEADRLAAELVRGNTTLTYKQALAQVFAERPELYDARRVSGFSTLER
jgi:hypothetical protein